MSKALLYIRVSSKEQEKEGYSLDAQERLAQEYALRNKLQIVKTYKVSESAWKEERTAFNLMVDYSKKHDDIEHIIFDITDRMTRNDTDKIKINILIKEFEKTIHFSRSNKIVNRYSNSDEFFMLDIEVAVAKKMSNDISRKTKMGMLEKAEQGLYPSFAPTGYKNNLLTHLIDPDEQTAPFITEAFNLIASGSYSLEMVCQMLYSKGFKTKRGKKFTKGTLSFILKNPIYYGIFNWNGKTYKGSHTTLISKEVFDRVQDVLGGKFHHSISKKNFPFNNLIKCGVCDCKILGEKKKEIYNYYHCTFSRGRHKGIGYIREERLALMFEEPIKKLTLSTEFTDWMKQSLRETDTRASESQGNRLSLLKREYDKANTRLSRLYDLKLDGEIESEVFKSKELELKNQITEIKAQLGTTKEINPNFYEDGIRTLELTNRLHPLYVKADFEEKAQILKTVASNFILTDENLYPIYKSPFSILAKGASEKLWLPGLDSNQEPFD